MNKLYIFGAFVGGAAVGATASWLLLKTKYEQYAQEEIDSVKEIYSKKAETVSEPDPIEDEELEKEIEQMAKDKMEEIINKEGYTGYSDIKKSSVVKKAEVKDDVEKPYVISPDEFDELDDYNTISLTYYADKQVVDDVREVVIENVDEIIGLANLETFGDYEDDSVFVRNDKLKTDYEILLDERTWAEVSGDGE